ncbi:MAG: mechanosensitive ion channel family protein [Bacteroidota bacterium]
MNKSIFIILILVLFTGLISYTQSEIIQDSSIVEPEIKPETAWVYLKGDSLFMIRNSLGPFSAVERAEMISRHLRDIYEEMEVVEDSFSISNESNTSIILYKGVPIMGITDKDIVDVGQTRSEVATLAMEAMRSAFSSRLKKEASSNTIRSIGITLALILGLVIIIIVINKIFQRINKRLIKYEQGLKRKRKSLFRYLAPKGPDYFFTFLSKLIKWALILLVLFFYLPLVFKYNQYTEHLVNRFYDFITEPIIKIATSFYEFLPNLFFIVIIILITRYITRVMSYISREIEQEKLVFKGFHKDWAKPTMNIFKIIVYVFALVFMFPFIPGSDSPAFQGVSIFLGVLFSLGSTSAIANAVAGIVITYMRPFAIGDRVKIGDTIGDVVSKSLLVTKVKTLKNEDVTIPNATIINGQLWNYTTNAKEIGIILHTSVTIGYDVPWDKVNELLLKAAKNTPNLTRDLKPFVLQKGLNDFYVEYELNVYTKQPQKMSLFYSELHKNILLAFNEAGIEILSPHYNAIRDGNDSTIPESTDTRNPVEKIIDNVKGEKSK